MDFVLAPRAFKNSILDVSSRADIAFIVPADDMGVVGHTQKNANSHVICKVKKKKHA
jgi:hypothetical protein